MTYRCVGIFDLQELPHSAGAFHLQINYFKDRNDQPINLRHADMVFLFDCRT